MTSCNHHFTAEEQLYLRWSPWRLHKSWFCLCTECFSKINVILVWLFCSIRFNPTCSRCRSVSTQKQKNHKNKQIPEPELEQRTGTQPGPGPAEHSDLTDPQDSPWFVSAPTSCFWEKLWNLQLASGEFRSPETRTWISLVQIKRVQAHSSEWFCQIRHVSLHFVFCLFFL